MAGRSALAIGAVALLAAAGTVLIGPSASAAELLANPGFEAGGLAPWSCGSTGSVVAVPVHSGGRALAGATSGSDTAQCTQTVSVQPNSSYVLSAWVRGSYVYLGVTGGASTWTPSAAAYTQLATTFTTGATQTSVEVYLHGWYAQGTYFADDVSLSGAVGNPGSPTPSAPGTPSPSPSPTPTPSPPPGGGSFRSPIYFMPLDNSPQNISTAMSASGAKFFNLAFVLDSGGCTPAWNGDSAHTVASDGTVTAVVNAIRA
ncbi:MAG: Carbohydrate-binding CenC domain protein, partial [Mycobacterium sp.]|nr:Carbohydrate-binding CenC domain protein [Mycobacterium sp.]